MEIIDFEKAKARMQSNAGKAKKQPKAKGQHKGKATKHLPGQDKGVQELQRQYREYAQFCNKWYDEHVIGQDKDGSWIYKD